MIINIYLAWLLLIIYCITVFLAVFVFLLKKGISLEILRIPIIILPVFIFLSAWYGVKEIIKPVRFHVISESGKDIKLSKSNFLIGEKTYKLENNQTLNFTSGDIYEYGNKMGIVINNTPYSLILFRVEYDYPILIEPDDSGNEIHLNSYEAMKTDFGIYHCGYDDIPPDEIPAGYFFDPVRGWVIIDSN
ncbi:MAG: hypothetical protein JW982_07915 [Spirochaetes bacterium]|nr:hypothetical protein [Spirochaetota bacterium]